MGFLEIGSGVELPAALWLQVSQGVVVKEAKVHIQVEWVNSRVSCVLDQSVLGILCVSKGELFLNFVALNSD